MRRCEDCAHARCLLGPAPHIPDMWECMARGGMPVLHTIARAMTCRVYRNLDISLDKKEER